MLAGLTPLMLQDHRIANVWKSFQQQMGERYMSMIQQGSITLEGKTMKFQYFTKGTKPQQGYTLIFGMHGGGGGSASTNDQQYNNHKHLYDNELPNGTIWFVPRSCQDVWDMWFQSYIPDFFSIVVKGFVLSGLVNANKVFISGYSAGGDGTYHLSSIMADSLAGAAMMAGHPNGVELFNTRNIAFSIQCGQNDSPYDRNKFAKEYIDKQQALSLKYGKFTTKYSRIVHGCEHWMNKKDAQIFNDFLRQERNPYPDFILFKQHNRKKLPFFYYIEVQPEQHKELMVVGQKGNTFYIQSQQINVYIYLNRAMVNFNQDVQIYHNGVLTVRRRPQTTEQIVYKTIGARGDPFFIFEDCMASVPKNGRVTLDVSTGQFVNSGQKW